jgi:hypothetical protein
MKDIIYHFTERTALMALIGCEADVDEKRIVMDPTVPRGLKSCSALSFLRNHKGYTIVIGKVV